MTKAMKERIFEELEKNGVKYGVDSTGTIFFENREERDKGMMIITGIMERRQKR